MKIALAVFLVFVLTGLDAANANQVTSAKVYAKALEVKSLVDQIAHDMGVEIQPKDEIDVINVLPREVYFQAVTLHQKANRLRFEFIADEANDMNAVKMDAQPKNVLEVLLKTEALFLDVVKTLRSDPLPLTSRQFNSQEIQPAEVFRLIVDLNRHTNELLEFKFNPAESHQKVTQAIALSSAILRAHKSPKSVFEPEPKERGKTPTDVYRKLIRMHAGIQKFMKRHNQPGLTLGDSELLRERVAPSDVYDLAVMFVSQLSFIHHQLPNPPPVKNSYYPGKVLPSDVYQRLSILEKQIAEMNRMNLSSSGKK